MATAPTYGAPKPQKGPAPNDEASAQRSKSHTTKNGAPKKLDGAPKGDGFPAGAG